MAYSGSMIVIYNATQSSIDASPVEAPMATGDGFICVGLTTMYCGLENTGKSHLGTLGVDAGND